MKICLILKCLGNALCVCMSNLIIFSFYIISFSLFLFSFFCSSLSFSLHCLFLLFCYCSLFLLHLPPSLPLSLPSLPPSLPLSPHSVCMVSCVTKEGIRDLQDRIHAAALNAKDPDTHEHVIGMQVHCVYVCVCVCVCVVHIKRHYYGTVLGLCASLLCVCVHACMYVCV